MSDYDAGGLERPDSRDISGEDILRREREVIYVFGSPWNVMELTLRACNITPIVCDAMFAGSNKFLGGITEEN